MYSPAKIYSFLVSKDLKAILEKPFHKRHMESDEIQSPFDTPEEILMLEHLIQGGYILALYRSDHEHDSEKYLISTMGHAFIKNYGGSIVFRFRALFHYFKHLHWVLFGSMMGSLIASVIWALFVE